VGLDLEPYGDEDNVVSESFKVWNATDLRASMRSFWAKTLAAIRTGIKPASFHPDIPNLLMAIGSSNPGHTGYQLCQAIGRHPVTYGTYPCRFAIDGDFSNDKTLPWVPNLRSWSWVGMYLGLDGDLQGETGWEVQTVDDFRTLRDLWASTPHRGVYTQSPGILVVPYSTGGVDRLSALLDQLDEALPYGGM
jgi:hypothetical protein